MNSALSANQTKQLKRFFQEIDKDSDGKIAPQELTDLLIMIWGKETEIDITSAVQSTFAKCDSNQDGFITFDELIILANY